MRAVAVAIVVAVLVFLLFHFRVIGSHASAPRPNPAMPKVLYWVMDDDDEEL